MFSLLSEVISEIRMGSPFNLAKIYLGGNYNPDLSGFDFQDIHCLNPSGTVAYLVQWEIKANEPGFRIIRICEIERSVQRSDRYIGCCESLRFVDEARLVVKIFADNKSREVEVSF